jgi:phosphotransferase system enzyme I (PtsP)
MSAAAAARQILTRLTEVMASRMHAQAKLDQFVSVTNRFRPAAG